MTLQAFMKKAEAGKYIKVDGKRRRVWVSYAEGRDCRVYRYLLEGGLELGLYDGGVWTGAAGGTQAHTRRGVWLLCGDSWRQDRIVQVEVCQ